jgi:hypothetical protein
MLTVSFSCRNSAYHLFVWSVPGGKVNILGGHSVTLSSVYVHVSYSEQFLIQLFHCTVHCTDEQHATLSTTNPT